jgi:hypothetical protein
LDRSSKITQQSKNVVEKPAESISRRMARPPFARDIGAQEIYALTVGWP